MSIYQKVSVGWHKLHSDFPRACAVCDEFVWSGEYKFTKPDNLPSVFFHVLRSTSLDLSDYLKTQYDISNMLTDDVSSETKLKLSHCMLSPRGVVTPQIL